MDKRYQVFVSSTFSDLKDERQAVLRAILEIDHMPAGMELFPAADATAWQIITDVIDASDYYVLVIGGRYGSLDGEGLGFTEKEYEYSVQTRKPVIPFLHEAPDNLPRDRTETDPEAWEKLKSFRAKVEGRHTCVYWRSPEDLKAKVIVGLTSATKRFPAVGWIRADKVPTDATVTEILALRKQISELQGKLETNRIGPPEGAEDLYQGSDPFEVRIWFVARKRGDPYPYRHDETYAGATFPTWNEMFAVVAPLMINEATDEALKSALRDFLARHGSETYKGNPELKERSLRDFRVSDSDIETVIVQFRALGLIRESQRARSVKDMRTYWSLTPYGDQLMTQLRALRRRPARAVSASAAPQPAEAAPSRQTRRTRTEVSAG
jgi:hypothetical protein